MAWHEVAQRGYKRIGAALMQETLPSIVDALRLGASLVAQRELRFLKKSVPIPIHFSNDRKVYLQWVEDYRPDAIIGRNHLLYQWLVESGYKVPGDIAFANLIAEQGKSLAGASVMVDKIGGAAVDHLIAELIVNHWGIPATRQTVELEPHWIDGMTMPDLSFAKG